MPNDDPAEKGGHPDVIVSDAGFKAPPPINSDPGVSSVAAAARELLGIERKVQEGLTPNDVRWSELVKYIFRQSGVDDHQRRSYRLPSAVPVVLKWQEGVMRCNMTTLSHMGMTFEGTSLVALREGDAFTFETAAMPEGEVTVGMAGRVVRRVGTNVVGAELLPDNTVSARERFFKRVYYPLYITFLEHLAAGGDEDDWT